MESLEGEIWKDVPICNVAFSVSNLGKDKEFTTF